jgi:hypothetical protein
MARMGKTARMAIVLAVMAIPGRWPTMCKWPMEAMGATAEQAATGGMGEI